MDEPMMSQKFLAWWQRNLAVLYVVVGTAVFGMCVLFWYAYGPVTAAWMWRVAHAGKATVDTGKVKLPGGWREHDGVSRADVHLERPYPWHAGLDTVEVDAVKGEDFARMLHTLQSLEKMAVEQGDVAAVYPLSDANAARFVCMEHGNAEEGTVHVTCLQKDGRRVVRMVGRESARQDYAAILSGIGAVR